MTFTVAIVGRPNVGKSTLFNRLVGRRLAIVHDMPGVTRDRKVHKASLAGMDFMVIDTAGLEDSTDESLEGRMRAQTEAALDEADIALFLIDSRAGVTPLDAHFAALLRKHPTPVILCANKCEGKAGAPGLYESWSLGLGEPVAVSAEHGEGMLELFQALLPFAREAGAEPPEDGEGPLASIVRETDDTTDGDNTGDEASDDDDNSCAPAVSDANAEEEELEPYEEPGRPDRPLQMAIVGRPNAGKSTLINQLLGQERMLTGPEAGITRDSVEIDWEWQGRRIRLVDTAGIRRRARIDNSLEKLSVAETLNAIRMAEVVVLMLDANAILEKQDLTIARMVIDEGRALVIAVNKWDAVDNRQEALQQLDDRLQKSLPQVRGIPTLTISALRGSGMDQLMKTAFAIHRVWNTRVTTSKLNRWLAEMTERHPTPLSKQGRRIRLRFMTQAKTRPPTYAIFASKPDELPDSYMRYLVNGLRETFAIEGVPIRIFLRKQDNPFDKK
ncbi:ribosome biogenesis GTPase Der [Haematospirillum jordaniae]|uniref:ribosome biogenesis GTPase Der n=1 Tax=Haematospirillum jordaniae TaxID=1549855 RepID=UPI001432C1A5|nr:ribosome biogenesis GTPase Der [Haematospirillum jordaniae]NKD85609.1 ribosome biogenesis GTPase Der [Haematospirillum jordaniae]